MWGLGGKEASRDLWGSEATLGFEGLSVFASWMARTAHDKPFHPPVLFSSFIWVRGAGDGGSCTVVVISRVSSGAGILFSQASAGLSLLIARSLSFPFSPIVPAPRSCGAGGLGRSKLFSFLPLRLSEGKAPSPGVGERQQLLSCLAQGSRNREGHWRKRRRIEWGNVFIRVVSISECVAGGIKVLRGTHLFSLSWFLCEWCSFDPLFGSRKQKGIVQRLSWGLPEVSR